MADTRSLGRLSVPILAKVNCPQPGRSVLRQLSGDDAYSLSKMFATSPGRSTWQSWPVFSSATSQPKDRALAENGAKNGLAGYSSATLETKVDGMLAFRLAGRRRGSSKQRRLKSH